jgi:hypothetical protein
MMFFFFFDALKFKFISLTQGKRIIPNTNEANKRSN